MLSLRTKLVLSYALLFLITFGVGAFSFFRFQRLSTSVDTVLRDNYKSILAADGMKDALSRMDSSAVFLLGGDAARARSEFEADSTRFEQQRNIAANNITEPGEDKIVGDIAERYARYSNDLRAFVGRDPHDPSLSKTYFSALHPQFASLQDRIDDLLKLNSEATRRADERTRASAQRARIWTLGLLCLSVLLAAAFAFFFVRYVITPLTQLIRGVRRIGQGDLDQHIEVRSRDEVGEVAAEFNRMAVRLRELRQSDLGRILVEQKKSDAVINSIYEPVIVTDADGAILKVNSAARQLMGNGTQAEGSRIAAALGGE